MFHLILFNQSKIDYLHSLFDRIFSALPWGMSVWLSASTPLHTNNFLMFPSFLSLAVLCGHDSPCHLSKGGYFVLQKLQNIGLLHGTCLSCIFLVLPNHLSHLYLQTLICFEVNVWIGTSHHASQSFWKWHWNRPPNGMSNG